MIGGWRQFGATPQAAPQEDPLDLILGGYTEQGQVEIDKNVKGIETFALDTYNSFTPEQKKAFNSALEARSKSSAAHSKTPKVEE